VDITNANGTIPNQLLSSNGGLDSDQFTGDTQNGVSVWLRARNDGQAPPPGGGDDPTVSPGSVSANASATYTLDGPASPTATGFKFEFQFSPKDGDTTSNSNYFLELALDKDPTANTDFADNILSGQVFGFWDQGDSLVEDGVTQRGGAAVEFNNPTNDRDSGNLPGYVVVNSWKSGWQFLLGDDIGAPRDGLFDLRLTAYADNNGLMGSQLAQVQVTADVAPIPLPAAGWLLLTAVGGLGVAARRRRKAA